MTPRRPRVRLWTTAFLAVALVAVAARAGSLGPARRPNIVLLLADDLGHSDLGCMGGEIATPNLDALAARGLRFTRFYNTARCWPSRAALMTGYYAQQVRRDTVPGIPSGTGGTRPAWAPLLATRLAALGYHAYHSGKWHLDGKPLANGFEHSYRLEDTDRHFAPRSHQLDDVPLPPVRPGDGYYSSTAIADHAIGQLRGHAREHPGEPFLAYVAFIAPHFPLQAPAADVARYRDLYRRGWDVLRAERWARMRRLGIGGSALSEVERAVGPPYAYPEAIRRLGPGEVDRPLAWDDLSPAQREFQASKMAVHAAMVDVMDREVGRILAQVDAMGATEDTLVLFLSDNGASAEMMVRGDGHDPAASPGADGTFLSLGPGWSTMANTPFRRHKTWVHEGGIATPFIASWPRGIRARGALRHAPGHVVDVVPTLLEVAGGDPAFARDGAPGPAGRSLVPAFARDAALPRGSLWWLHEGNRALRVGDWKIVAAGKGAPWELYDLSRDRSESRDLSASRPAKLRELAARWEGETSSYFRAATNGAAGASR